MMRAPRAYWIAVRVAQGYVQLPRFKADVAREVSAGNARLLHQVKHARLTLQDYSSDQTTLI